MKIQFDQFPETRLERFWGGEGALRAKMLVDDRNKILRGVLAPGHSIGYHVHDTSSEIIFFLSGTGKTVTDGVEETVTAGDCHYCKKGQQHRLINDGDEELIFFAVVPVQ